MNELLDLVRKKYMLFTDRGNTSIKLALELAKSLGFKEMLIQDQGGWLTYEQIAKKQGLIVSKLKTDYGIVNDGLKENSILLINSMPGYAYYQENMDKIEHICFEKNILLINDVSGSIGSPYSKYGDIILGSFGRWKPLNLEYGGFLATDNTGFIDYFNKHNGPVNKIDLKEKLQRLDKRIKRFCKINSGIKKDLKDFNIVHRDKTGFNVIIRFKTESKKEEIINYCSENNLEYTLCPRYIRVMDDAVSIEVKRQNI